MAKRVFDGWVNVESYKRVDGKLGWVKEVARVELSVDVEKLLQIMGDKVAASKRGRAIGMKGAVSAKLLRLVPRGEVQP